MEKFNAPSRNLSTETEENQENLSHSRQSSGRDLKQGPSEYEANATFGPAFLSNYFRDQ